MGLQISSHFKSQAKELGLRVVVRFPKYNGNTLGAVFWEYKLGSDLQSRLGSIEGKEKKSTRTWVKAVTRKNGEMSDSQSSSDLIHQLVCLSLSYPWFPGYGYFSYFASPVCSVSMADFLSESSGAQSLLFLSPMSTLTW